MPAGVGRGRGDNLCQPFLPFFGRAEGFRAGREVNSVKVLEAHLLLSQRPAAPSRERQQTPRHVKSKGSDPEALATRRAFARYTFIHISSDG